MQPITILFLTLLSACLGYHVLHTTRVNRVDLNMANFDLDKTVSVLSKNRILTKTAELGLLSRLEKAGFTLSSASPLLKKADELDLLGVLESSSDKVLPLVATAIDLAPSLLPLASAALKIPPSALTGGAFVSLAAAAAVVALIPDDSVGSIALQTALTIPLGIILPVGLFAGNFILGKLGSK